MNHVQTEKDGEGLAAYENGNYRADPCRIRYTDGKELGQELGHMLKFVRDKRDLRKGAFDLRVWLRGMGRQGAVDKLEAKSSSATK